MFSIQILNVKNWFAFMDAFKDFLNCESFVKAMGVSNVVLKFRFHGTLLLEVDGVQSVGDFEHWDLYADDVLIGSLDVTYMDQHFFSLSVEAIDALLTDEELKSLMLSGPSWAVPVGPIKLIFNSEPSDDVKDLIKKFVSNYVDDYPNEIARKFAPRMKIR